MALMVALESAVPEAEALVGSFRDLHDEGAAVGVPAHKTVLYPFKPPDEIDEAVLERLRHLFSRFEPFNFALTTIRRFSGEALYLAPEPEEPFRRLTLTAWKYSPEAPPYGGVYSTVVPHLTVARIHDDQRLDEIAREFERAAQGKATDRRTRSRSSYDGHQDGTLEDQVCVPAGCRLEICSR
jgi:2'-5' RNA ligase